jgi:hypothetical protein
MIQYKHIWILKQKRKTVTLVKFLYILFWICFILCTEYICRRDVQENIGTYETQEGRKELHAQLHNLNHLTNSINATNE